MKTAYPQLFSEIQVGKTTFKNRIVMPPMASNLANADGSVSPQILAYYEARAKGGVGMIIIENISVDYPRGKDISNQLRLDDMKYAAGIYDLTEIVHSYGAKIIAQLQHSGNQTTLGPTEDVELWAPSGVPCPLCMTQPNVMSTADIKDLIRKFINAAQWAKVGGCDGVEVHGTHGYLIQQFMSPSTNKRVDEYGGTLERRMRVPLDIVKGIREVCGDDFLISFRLSVDEYIDDGYDLEEGIKIAKILENAGIDILNASAGCYRSIARWLEPQGHEQGERLYIAEACKKALSIPVITVGVLRTPDICERAIADGIADFVATGRTLIADPEWPNKVRENRVDEIRKCISCIHCVGDNIHPGKRLRCTVNPECGYEWKYPNITEAKTKKNVAVVGGGPAGMTAAVYAARRGHSVTLYEKTGQLSGQLNIASVPPGKDVIDWVGEYLESELKRQGVEIKLNSEITKDTLKELQTDHVILATGSKPFTPDIPGIEKTIPYWDYLGRIKEINENNIVIAGGGIVGSEVAHMLAEQGKNVTILEILEDIALELEPTSRGEFLGKLNDLGVKKIVNVIITEITEDGVKYVLKNGAPMFISADKVVSSFGQTSVKCLKKDLDELEIPYTVIGDANEVGRIANATRNGMDAAIHL